MFTIGDSFPFSIPKIPRRTAAEAPPPFPSDRVSSAAGLDPDVLRLRHLHRQAAPPLTPPALPHSHYRIASSAEAPRGQPQLPSYPAQIHTSNSI